MLTESQAIKLVAKRYKGKPVRMTMSTVQGRNKRFTYRAGRTLDLGLEAARAMQAASGDIDWFRWHYGWGSVALRRRLRKRIMKKLRQPFRRKDRGPLRRRAAGKNEVTRRH